MNEAFGDSDWTAFAAALASDAVYEEPATGRRTEGPAANVTLAKEWKTAFPDAHGRLDR
ncbi:MAG: ester cyclase, partial [Chloroflexota bacterium]